MEKLYNFLIFYIKNLFILFLVNLLVGQSDQLIKKASKKTGLSESFIKKTAKEKGYSDADILGEAKKRGYLPESNANINNNNGLGSDNDLNKGKIYKEDKIKIENQDRYDLDEIIKKNKKKSYVVENISNYFGYDIFRSDPKSFQASSFGSINPNYNIGPGDEVIIMIWGETQFRQVYIIDSEGYLFIPDVGQVFVNGLNLGQLEKKLFKQLSKIYSSLTKTNKEPTTFLDVSLGKLRPLRITVLGEVNQPGSYIVDPMTTLFTSLYYFRGPTINGSLRDIHLIRDGKKIGSIDFYDYLLKGTTIDDIQLQLGDIIFIPKRLKTVSISGEIKREHIFEIKDGEQLIDLIKIAGGLKTTAYLERAQIDRIIPFNERNKEWNDRILIDFNLGSFLKKEISKEIKDGDKIKIFSIKNEFINDVYIEGSSIPRPGVYELTPNMTILELINKAGGISSDTYLKNANLIRKNENGISDIIMSVNLSKVLENDPNENLELKWNDKVKIFSLSDLIPQYSIILKGHVKKPGRYKFYKNLTLYDLLFEYGGFLDTEWKEKTWMEKVNISRLGEDGFSRNLLSFNLSSVLENLDTEEQILLEPDDIVTVFGKNSFLKENYVTIEGMVKNPGRYFLKEEMNLNNLVLEAGGFNENLYSFKIDISRINPKNSDLEKYASNFSFKNGRINFDFNYNGREISELYTFVLKPYDIVSVREDPYFSKQRIIEVSGEVLYPGKYVILSSKDQLFDLVDRAGGLKSTAFLEGSLYFRDDNLLKMPIKNILKRKNKYKFYLQDGDKVIFKKRPNKVVITGQVNNPGSVFYIKGENLNYYIKKSGGFNDDANLSNIWLTYPNGLSKKWQKYSLFSSSIPDGSVINVSKKEEQDPVNKTELFSDISSIFADLIQALSIVLITRSN